MIRRPPRSTRTDTTLPLHDALPVSAEPVSPLRVALAAATMSLSHQGTGAPWATVSVKAAVPLKEPLNAGYRIKRSVSIVKAAHKDRLTRGDVIKVRIEVVAAAGRTWVGV